MTTRTFGLGDSAEQSLNVEIMQELHSAHGHLREFKRTHRLRDFFRCWRATRRANRKVTKYERIYGSFTPGVPAPFAE